MGVKLLGKVKIHEIAKEIGIANKDLIEKANELGINVSSHMSSIEVSEAEKIKNSFNGKNSTKTKKGSTQNIEKKQKKDSAPVIIRREVIINEEQNQKTEEKKTDNRKDVGFVERDKNKDYNIVYRKQPIKPLTASELFGIKPKNVEEQKEIEVVKIEEVQNVEKQNNIDMEQEVKNKMIETVENKIVKKEQEEQQVQNIQENNRFNPNNKPNNYNAQDNRVNNRNNDNRSDDRNSDNRFNRNGDNRFDNKTNSDNRFNNRPNNEDRYGNRPYNNSNNSDRPAGDNRFNKFENRERTNNLNNNQNSDNRFQNRNNNNGQYQPRNNNNGTYQPRNSGDGQYQPRNNNNGTYQPRNSGDGQYQPRNNNNGTYQPRNSGDGQYQPRNNNNGTYQPRNSGDGQYQPRNNNNGTYQPRNNNGTYQPRNNNNGTYQPRNNNFNRNGRPLDDKGIDKNIKEIISIEVLEKENQRDYSSRAIDKEKQSKFEESKGAKKPAKTKKTGRFENFDEEKLKNLKQVDKLSNMFSEQDGGMLDYYDLTTERGKRNRKKIRNDQQRIKQKIFELTEINIPDNITVKDLAVDLKKTSAEVIKKLFGYGIMATVNNEIDFDTAFLVAQEFGVKANKKESLNEEDILFDESEDSDEELVNRPPVVVVMGHVDHGKTSLLDAIRSTNVIQGEAGGITQHIGAYMVNINGRDITFLDTPGHEAFTSMRARGAQITDIAILVVAADDGVMPQTVEAINHAKAANIPIIVAVNKIDLPNANVDKIKQELMKYDLVAEEWGGETIFVPISAMKNINIENLLEMVLLVADMQELKVNPKKQAKGAVIEARLDKAKGPIASVLVQRGTLDIGDTVVVGKSIGRIRAMKNDKGHNVKEAGPSTPVEIMGLTEVPEAGDIFYEVKNEKMAKHLIEKRRIQEREKVIGSSNVVTLDNLFEKMETGDLKQLNIIVKADVQGSAEAVKQSLEKLSDSEVKVKVIHAIAGAVTESDVQLAKAASAIIIGFNVRPVPTAKIAADKEGVEIKQYSIIYKAIEDVEAAMKGMLDPVFEEKVIGNAEVRQVFKVSNVGSIAGCYVTDGKIERNAGVRVIRESVVIHEGKLSSLKRFKEDVKEAAKGYECGVQIEKYNDIKEGDIIEAFVMQEIKR